MPVPGFVYVLSNAELPQFVKVGMTNELARRLVEINAGAGVVGRWSIYGSVLASDMRLLEAKAHLDLALYRLSGSTGTEIFRCTTTHAAAAVIRQATVSEIKLYENTFPVEPTRAEDESLRKRLDGVCTAFPDLISAWARAIKSNKTRAGFELDPLYASRESNDLRVVLERVASIIGTWGLKGREEALYGHIVKEHRWMF